MTTRFKYLSLFFLVSCGSDPHAKLPEGLILPPTYNIQYDESALKYRPALNKVLTAFMREKSVLLFRRGIAPRPGESALLIGTTREGWSDWGGTLRWEYIGDGKVIYLWPDISPNWDHLLISLTHELGHVLGFDHSPDPYHIMYYSTTAKEHTLEESVAQIWEEILLGNDSKLKRFE